MRLGLGIMAAALLATACGSTVVDPSSSGNASGGKGTGGAGGEKGTASASVGAAGDCDGSDLPCCSPPSTDPACCVECGEVGATTGSGQPPIKSCGGGDFGECDATEYCAFSDGVCGTQDPIGECHPRPTNCDASYQPVCGCDDQVHGNPCDAMMNGWDLSALGSCAIPAGTFPCGAHFCSIATEVCHESDEGDSPQPTPNLYRCDPLPAACDGKPSCDEGCAQAVCFAAFCNLTVEGGMFVDCPGGG